MCTGRGSNQGPLGPKSDALNTAPLRHLIIATSGSKMCRSSLCYSIIFGTLGSAVNEVYAALFSMDWFETKRNTALPTMEE